MPKLRAVPHSEKKLIDDHGSTLDVLRRDGVGLRRWENMRVGEAAATTCKPSDGEPPSPYHGAGRRSGPRIYNALLMTSRPPPFAILR